MRRYWQLWTAAVVLFGVGCEPVASTAREEPGTPVEATRSLGFTNGALVQLPRWKWQGVMENMNRIRDTGFTAILLPPHTATCGGVFSAGYDPSDFANFNGGFGSESDLGWLIGTAHWFNIQVYADMILNHMCPSNYSYPRFSWNDFHHNGEIRDYNDWWDRENRDLFGLNDLAQESGYVRGELWNYVVKSRSIGFDGFRWDAAKHVPIWFWKDHIVGNVNAWGKYNFGEVYSANLWELDQYVGSGMAVTDYALYDVIQRVFRFGGNMAELDGAGYAARNSSKALTFVENHDVGAPPNRLLAYAFLSAYLGYPMYQDTTIGDPKITNLVWIHNRKAHGNYINRYKDHDVFVFERDRSLLTGLNQSGGWASRWVATGWSNQRLHDYTGHTGDVWTNHSGWVEIHIPPGSYVMFSP